MYHTSALHFDAAFAYDDVTIFYILRGILKVVIVIECNY